VKVFQVTEGFFYLESRQKCYIKSFSKTVLTVSDLEMHEHK